MHLKQLLFTIIGIIGILFTLSSLAGLVFGIFHHGSLLLLFIGLFLMTTGFLGPVLESRNLYSKSVSAALILSVLAIFFFAGFSLALYSGGKERLPENPADSTVIVLGGKVEQGRPTLMVARRLWVAADYLMENPEANCIVAGGQGIGETETEASVMKQFLIEQGIDAARILEEDQSTDTYQNLAFSKQIIDANGLSNTIVIATDGFHQMRAAFYASHLDFSGIYSLPSETPWGLLPGYAAREILSMVKALIIEK